MKIPILALAALTDAGKGGKKALLRSFLPMAVSQQDQLKYFIKKLILDEKYNSKNSKRADECFEKQKKSCVF